MPTLAQAAAAAAGPGFLPGNVRPRSDLGSNPTVRRPAKFRRKQMPRGYKNRTRRSSASRRWRPAKRSGVYGKRWLQRPNVGAVQRPLVQRKVEAEDQQTWAIVDANLHPAYTLCPGDCFYSYTQGFDISQVLGRAIHSRNVTCHLQLQMPTKASSGKPYQFRIVQGFCKFAWVGKSLKSTAGVSGMTDGYINLEVGTTPQTQTVGLAHDAVQDYTGSQNGAFDASGNTSKEALHIISDKTQVIACDQLAGDGTTLFPSKVSNYNWKINKRLRLYNYTNTGDPANATSLTPANNPGLWIPFISMMLINHYDYTGDDDRPKFKLTWTHYFTNLS